MNMIDIDSLVDSLIMLATWPYIQNYLDKHRHVPPKITDQLSLLVNCRVKLTGMPLVMTIRSGAVPKSGESLGSAPRGFSRLALCR
jgi:hypothetical protein